MKNYKGFTIIELIVYIGLSSILIALMSEIFLATLGVRIESQSTTNVQQDARYILSRITYDVRRASAISVPLVDQTGSTLTLVINEQGVDQTHTYSVQGTDLVLTVGSDTDSVNSTGTTIGSLAFERIGETVEIVMTLVGNEQVSPGQQELSVRTTVGRR